MQAWTFGWQCEKTSTLMNVKTGSPPSNGMHAEVLQSSMLTYWIAYMYSNKKKIEK